jgi:hypothetical protein
VDFCNPASGWEKGQVEKNVQDARRRLWQPMPNFPDIDALNVWLEEHCIAQWGHIKHGGLPSTVADVHADEVCSLMPQGRIFDGFVEHRASCVKSGTDFRKKYALANVGRYDALRNKEAVMRHDPASAAIVVKLRSLKMYGMAGAVSDLIEQGTPAFEAAVPILSQLLKAEMTERDVRSIAYHIKAARVPSLQGSGRVRLCSQRGE